MKKEAIYLGIISICLFYFLNQAAFCGNELTREKAKDIIIKASQYPQVDYIEIYFKLANSTYFDNKNGYDLLNRDGMLRLQELGQGYYRYIVNLTNKGKKYLIRNKLKGEVLNGQEYYGDSVYIFQTATIIFGEITGIVNIQPNISIVQYTDIVTDLTPFGHAFGATAGAINKEAKFILYDDGWRLVKEGN